MTRKAGTSVTVTGADQIAAAMRGLADDLTDFGDVNRQAAAALAAAASRRAPRRSGRLAGSFRPAATDSTATVTSSVRYGVPVAARNPFWSRALADTWAAREQSYDRKVTTAVRKANK